MIKEEYVSWDSAKLLKEAGFPQESQMYYDVDFGKLCQWSDAKIAAPTQALAMRWLRSKKLYINIISRVNPTMGLYGFEVVIKTIGVRRIDGIIIDIWDCNNPPMTYEAAAEAGIKAACEYIIQNKQR